MQCQMAKLQNLLYNNWGQLSMTKIIQKSCFAIYISLLCALFFPSLDYEKSIQSVSLRGHYQTFNAPMFEFVDSVMLSC